MNNRFVKISTKLIKAFFKSSISIVFTLLFLVISLLGVIQIPKVQKYLIDNTTFYISEKLDFPVQIGGVDIDWFDVIVLEKVLLKDPFGGEMIQINALKVDYTIHSLFKGEINIDNITLKDGKVDFIVYPEMDGYVNMSEFVAAIEKLTASSAPSNPNPKPFVLNRFTLENMKFRHWDLRNAQPDQTHFHEFDFTFDSIYGSVTDFTVIRDSIIFDVFGLKTRLANSPVRIKELNTRFLLCKKKIELADLFLKTNHSEVSDLFRLSFDDIKYLSDFNEKVTMYMHLKNSLLDLKDFGYFIPFFEQFEDKYFLSGDFEGKIHDFRLKKMNIDFGRSSHVFGDIHFDGLPNIDSTVLDIQLKKLYVTAADMEQYTGKDASRIIKRMGRIKGDCDFYGLYKDFKASGNFYTDIGDFSSDLQLQINPKNFNASTYNGKLITHRLNLGYLIGTDRISYADLNGTIIGKGFELNSAKVDVDVHVKRIGILKYNYHNIDAKGNLSDRFFEGEFSVLDSNLIISSAGKIDMKEKPEVFDIHGKLTKINPSAIGLTNLVSHLSTDFYFDFKGTDIDSIQGSVLLNNFSVGYQNKNIDLKSVYVNSEINQDIRTFEFESEVGEVEIEGNYKFATLYEDILSATKEFLIFAKHDKNIIRDYYSKKETTNREKYKVDFKADLRNANKLIQLYYPEFYISQNTYLEGSFGMGKATMFNITSGFDTLIYKGNEFYENKIDISISKLTDSASVLAMLYVNSNKQLYSNNKLKTENLTFNAEWLDDTINFNSFIKQFKSDNIVSLNGKLAFEENGKKIFLNNSYVNLFSKKWTIPDSNSIAFNTINEFTFSKLQVKNEEQNIMINGTVSRDPSKESVVLMRSFDLKNFNPFIQNKLDGDMDGFVRLKDFYNAFHITSALYVHELKVDNFIIGDLIGHTLWNSSNSRIDVDLDLTRNGFVMNQIRGFIIPPKDDKEEYIELTSKLNETDLSIISPLLVGVLSDIRGVASGSLELKGSLKNLELSGSPFVKNGHFKVDFTNVGYNFNDRIHLNASSISFKNTILTDSRGRKGSLNGGIYHDSFRNFLVDISGDFNDLMLLNTDEKHNSTFYGEAFGSGSLSIFGPFSEIKITVDATTEKDTRIFIPIGTSSSSVTQKSYINFVNKVKGDSLQLKDSVSSSSVKLDLNLSINKLAYTEIVFDKQSGDIIRGRGQGDLRINYDSKADMNMYGNFNIEEGFYNFTMLGLINKEFKIDKGSSISWNGDPYEGILDIKAKYNQNVSLKPLVTDTTLRKNPQLTSTYPVDVLLGVKGNLLSPEISMDIDILRTPSDINIKTVVADFDTKIKSNDQELNRQVFSLIMLRSFAEQNSIISSPTSTTANISELFANQLSNFLSQVDDKLEVSMNLGTLDRDALNTFSLRLSYTLLDGRLRITRDGNFQNAQSSSTVTNLSNIAGEWTIEYLLDEEGNFRLKLFNKNNNNSLLNSLNNTGVSAGFSLMHSQGFDKLNDIFKPKKKRKKKQKKAGPIEPPVDVIK